MYALTVYSELPGVLLTGDRGLCTALWHKEKSPRGTGAPRGGLTVCTVHAKSRMQQCTRDSQARVKTQIAVEQPPGFNPAPQLSQHGSKLNSHVCARALYSCAAGRYLFPNSRGVAGPCYEKN